MALFPERAELTSCKSYVVSPIRNLQTNLFFELRFLNSLLANSFSAFNYFRGYCYDSIRHLKYYTLITQIMILETYLYTIISGEALGFILLSYFPSGAGWASQGSTLDNIDLRLPVLTSARTVLWIEHTPGNTSRTSHFQSSLYTKCYGSRISHSGVCSLYSSPCTPPTHYTRSTSH